MAEKNAVTKAQSETVTLGQAVCTPCGKPATRLVDGEPSCEVHIERVYEHQLEDYTPRTPSGKRVA